tara:strand:+ start:316 stop:1527 length:1212 start_codon:yes stop_codon:yes gene_type:complete
MITYKTIIEYFDVICERHQQIKSFTYGEMDFFDENKFTKYPAVHITPVGTSLDDQVVVYGFDVVVFDRYNVESNKMRNEASCLSDSLLILQDLCKELREGKYFINEDTNIRLSIPIIATPFIDTEPDNCSGWSTSFEVTTPNEVTASNIPYYTSEIQKGLDYTLPSSVADCVWYSREQIHSKGTFSGQELIALAPVVDNVSGSDTLIMNGSSVKWNPEKNALHMYDISNTVAMNLEHPQEITTTEATFYIRIKDFGRYVDVSDNNVICYFGDVDTFTNGFYLFINSSGELSCYSFSDATTIASDFPVVPKDGAGSTASNQHKRLESLTICIQVTTTKIIVWYGMTSNERMEMNTSFEFDGKIFGIGNPLVAYKSDFYLQEYLYIPEAVSVADIEETMQWLNYR